MDELQKRLDEAVAQLATEQGKTAQLTKELETEREARGKAEQELRDANTLIDALNQAAKPADERPTAKLGKGKDVKTYRFVVPQFYLTGFGVVKAADVKDNSPVLEALVKAGSHVVEEVPAK